VVRVAAVFFQKISLFLRFDSFGNHDEIQAFPECDDCAHDGSIHNAGKHIVYKALVDLALIQR
jgi:hypothetical protein